MMFEDLENKKLKYNISFKDYLQIVKDLKLKKADEESDKEVVGKGVEHLRSTGEVVITYEYDIIPGMDNTYLLLDSTTEMYKAQ